MFFVDTRRYPNATQQAVVVRRKHKTRFVACTRYPLVPRNKRVIAFFVHIYLQCWTSSGANLRATGTLLLCPTINRFAAGKKTTTKTKGWSVFFVKAEIKYPQGELIDGLCLCAQFLTLLLHKVNSDETKWRIEHRPHQAARAAGFRQVPQVPTQMQGVAYIYTWCTTVVRHGRSNNLLVLLRGIYAILLVDVW